MRTPFVRRSTADRWRREADHLEATNALLASQLARAENTLRSLIAHPSAQTTIAANLDRVLKEILG